LFSPHAVEVGAAAVSGLRTPPALQAGGSVRVLLVVLASGVVVRVFY
jgi:hypothetical protein